MSKASGPGGGKAFDIIVIGGGALGAATIFELSKQNFSIGWIFDYDTDSQSATHAAGAMLGAYGEIGTKAHDDRENEEFDYRLASQRLYPEWLQELIEISGHQIFEAKGSFVVGNTAGTTDRLTLNNILLFSESNGGQAETVDPTLVPGLQPSDRYSPLGCVYLPHENAISTADLNIALRKAASKQSNVSVSNELVTRLEPANESWNVICTKGEYSAANIVLCAGSRSMDLLSKELRAEHSIPDMYFGKGTSAIVSGDCEYPHTIRTPNRAFACGAHIVPHMDDQIYIGATNYFGTDHKIENGPEVGELHILFDQVIHQLNTRIRSSKILQTNFGFRPISINRRPLVGATGSHGLFLGTATYRNGIVMAPLIAKHIVADVLDSDVEQNNPYRPRDQIALSSSTDIRRLINEGVKDLVGIMHEPNGILPYNRSQELEKLLSVLFQMAIFEGSNSELRSRVRKKLETIPLNETMNRIFYEIVNEYDRIANPNVSEEFS